jgi:phage terminase Nu1 subunit (DNA packaging protein)
MSEGQVTGKVLASMLGVTDRALRDFAERGLVVKTGRGTYELAASIRRYCEHMREVAAGRGGEEGVLDLTAERARLAKEQADAQALKNAVAREELLPAADVERQWREVLAGVRSRMLAVPSRTRQALPHLTASEVTIIDREVRDALMEVADGGAA